MVGHRVHAATIPPEAGVSVGGNGMHVDEVMEAKGPKTLPLGPWPLGPYRHACRPPQR